MAANDHDFVAEEPANHAQKTLCVLVVDRSGSMGKPVGGVKPIDELNKGLKQFREDILADSATADRLEISVVQFNEKFELVVGPSLAADLRIPTLVAKGDTAMVDASREGISLVRDRKAWYKETGQPHLRPWIILITDGTPDTGQDVDGLSREVKAGVDKQEFSFLPIAVEGADIALLTQIAHPSMPPLKLKGLKFGDFFKWLSASMVAIASAAPGQKVTPPSPTAWMQGVQV
jgi:uncharacterized protein YegL